MRDIIKTDKAPAAIGPYSQAVRTGNLVFCSGQIALDPASGKINGETAGEQCKQVMKNLGAVLEAAGSGYDRLIKTTIFLSDMGDFAEVNEVYASFLSDQPPARATVAVLGLPMGVKIEVEAIARCD